MGATVRDLELARAKEAWNIVQQVKKQHTNRAKEFLSLARSAPADIQVNGLAQTLAFWAAKSTGESGAHFALLSATVSAWVLAQLGIEEEDSLLQWILETDDLGRYRWATREALAFLEWIKRFAEAELSGE